jgi:hypothetical protein
MTDVTRDLSHTTQEYANNSENKGYASQVEYRRNHFESFSS